MGSYFQSVAFPTVTAAEAKDLASKLLEGLVARGILLGAENPDELAPGYPPGPRAHELTEPGFEHTRELLANGVVFETERNVFHAGGNGLELTCRACGLEHSPDSAIGDLVQQWFDGDDDVLLTCRFCGHRERLVDWDGPWPWAFGHLGVTFLGWPRLRPELVRIMEGLVGHPARVVLGTV